jgi:hypothetical protein
MARGQTQLPSGPPNVPPRHIYIAYPEILQAYVCYSAAETASVIGLAIEMHDSSSCFVNVTPSFANEFLIMNVNTVASVVATNSYRSQPSGESISKWKIGRV